MKKICLLAVLAAMVVSIALCGFHAAAQGPVRSGPPIALLDVSHVFKSHVRFKSMMNEMKASVERAEAWAKGERDTIQKMAEELKTLKTGTAAYKELEERTATRMGQLEVQIRLQKKQFLEHEAKVYHSVYQEVQQEVNSYMAATGTTLVLRFSGEPVDPTKPDTVIRDINKPVIAYHPQLDITELVLQRLNRPDLNPGLGDRRGGPTPMFNQQPR